MQNYENLWHNKNEEQSVGTWERGNVINKGQRKVLYLSNHVKYTTNPPILLDGFALNHDHDHVYIYDVIINVD